MSNNTVAQNLRFWNNYDWSRAGDEWSAPWGDTGVLWYGTLMPRMGRNLPTRTVLEIAPGSGRFTQFLKDHCEQYIGVDLSTTCVENCKQRFGRFSHMSFHLNDGKSLEMIEDDSINFVFSHDSLVHAEADVLESYLKQLAQKLVVGGTGYFHFSNFRKVRELEASTGANAVANTHGRAENMSGEQFSSFCKDSGLALLTLEIIDWGPQESDALGIFARLPAGAWPETKVAVNSEFMAEASRLRKLSLLYSPPLDCSKSSDNAA